MSYPLHPRLTQIEAELEFVRGKLLGQQIPARPGERTMIRLAKTHANESTEYPDAADEPNCYWIVFADDDAAEPTEHGTHTPTVTDRQADPAALVYNLGGGYIAEGTLLWVFCYYDRWYTYTDSQPIVGFQLKYALTPGGSAEAYRMNWNTSAYVPDLTGATLTVHDTLSICRGRATASSPATAGSCGWCFFREDSQQWEILAMQPWALWVWASVDETYGVAATRESFAVDAAALLQPIGGLLPAAPDTAFNPLGLTFLDGDLVLLAWNETAVHWDAIAGGRPVAGEHLWGKVQTGFGNDSGDVSRTVSVIECAWDGSGETGDPFDVQTPLRANKDTALFYGYVVRFALEPTADYVIDSDCFDDPIGTCRWVNVETAVRDGWEEVTEARDKFLKGLAAADEDYGDTGGVWPDAHGDHTLSPTTTCINAPAGTGVNVYGFASPSDVTLEHTNNPDGTKAYGPPWLAYKLIRRFE